MRTFVVLVASLAGVGCEKVDSGALPPPAQATIASSDVGAAPVRMSRERVTQLETAVPVARRAPIPAALQWFRDLETGQRGHIRQFCRLRRREPCAGLVPMPHGDRPDPAATLLAGLDAFRAHAACDVIDPGARHCDTPLVLAFDDRPVAFATTTFAFSPGSPVETAWPTAATPWIALDRDRDGAITSGRELFGDATLLPGGETATHGFAALAALDADGNGTIDRRDPAFASLLIWTDRDSDGASTPSELRPLSEVVDAIPLAHELRARCGVARGYMRKSKDRVLIGCEGQRGSASLVGGGSSAVIDVYLTARSSLQ